MYRHTRSDRGAATYRTYDDRAVSQDMIEKALQVLDARARRKERMQQVQVWLISALLVIGLLAACLFIWWRLGLPV
jgi:hypothetical protein